MNEINCENVMMAAMAMADGEEPTMSAGMIELHLAACENCRGEIEKMATVDLLFEGQARLAQDADLWPLIEARIAPQKAADIGWGAFLVLGALLVGYKFLEMLPEQGPGHLFKLVPLVIVAVLFLVIRENPFKINSAVGEVKI